jgi:hypothetical protein
MAPRTDSLDDPGSVAQPRPADAAAGGASDVLAGLLFAGFGMVALVVGRDYAIGTALRMGPGYLPRIVAAGLVILGCASIARGVIVGGWRPPGIAWRPVALIAAAVFAFALTIDRLGLVIASLAAVAIAASAEPGVRWRHVPLVAMGIAAFAAILFGYVLKLSIPIWPR